MSFLNYKEFLWVALICMIMGCSATESSVPVPRELSSETIKTQPNIVIIMADDLGWGDISLNGADFIKTPNMDRIGHEGVQLTRFYAGANACTPSRAALLTGRYPFRSGMEDVLFPYSSEGLPQSEVTLPEILKQAGYATGMVGKWHLGQQIEHWPTEHGFDDFFGVAYSNDMKPFDLYHHKTIVETDIDQTQLTNKYASAAADFIKQNAAKDEPFFLYIAESFPHIPLFVPEDASGISEAGLYGDVVQHLDAGIGRVLDALDASAVADDTLIIITSDNGPWFEGDQGARHRGRKGGTHEGGYLVPFLARWPKHIQAGQSSDAMAMNIDLLPTLALLAGATLPKDRIIDGKNISSLLNGEGESPHEVLYFFNGTDIGAIRDRDYRLLLKQNYNSWYVPFEQLGGALLFDLKKDPSERFSYSRDNPEIVRKLSAHVKTMRAEVASVVKTRAAKRPNKTDPDTYGPDLEE